MDRITELAEAQHGIVSRDQCRRLGLDSGRLRAALRRGEWERVAPKVLRRVGAPWTAEAAVSAGVLAAGGRAVASHRTAAALWRLPGFDLLPVEASRPRGSEGRRPRGVRLHEPRYLPAGHTTSVNGIPLTTPARTLFDLAGVLHPARTERALDNAVAMSPALLRALHRMLPELGERGRSGSALMRRLLDERPGGYVAPASGLEARVIRLLDAAGIPARRQVDVGADDWIGRVDVLIEGTDLVVEVDSARYHASPLDSERDARRDAALHASGRRVVRLTEEEVWQRPREAVARVRRAMHPRDLATVSGHP